jgi:hypothetical protein
VKAALCAVATPVTRDYAVLRDAQAALAPLTLLLDWYSACSHVTAGDEDTEPAVAVVYPPIRRPPTDYPLPRGAHDIICDPQLVHLLQILRPSVSPPPTDMGQ